MKREILGVAIVLALVCFAHARIGETPDQCEKRYGAHSEEQRGDQLLFRSYSKQGYSIEVIFAKAQNATNYVAHGIIYVKPGSFVNESLSKDEIEKFLQSNGNGKTWRHLDVMKQAFDAEGLEQKAMIEDGMKFETWVRSDGVLSARYDNIKDMLVIYTDALKAHLAKQKEKDLSDF